MIEPVYLTIREAIVEHRYTVPDVEACLRAGTIRAWGKMPNTHRSEQIAAMTWQRTSLDWDRAMYPMGGRSPMVAIYDTDDQPPAYEHIVLSGADVRAMAPAAPTAAQKAAAEKASLWTYDPRRFQMPRRAAFGGWVRKIVAKVKKAAYRLRP